MVKDNWKSNYRHILLLGKTKELLWNNVLITCLSPFFQGLICCRAKQEEVTPCLPVRMTASSSRLEASTAASIRSTPSTWTRDGKSHLSNIHKQWEMHCLLQDNMQHPFDLGSVYTTFHGLSYLQSHSHCSDENRPKWKPDWRQSWGQSARHEAPKRKSGWIISEIATTFIFRGVQHVFGPGYHEMQSILLSHKCDNSEMPKERNFSCSPASPHKPFHFSLFHSKKIMGLSPSCVEFARSLVSAVLLPPPLVHKQTHLVRMVPPKCPQVYMWAQMNIYIQYSKLPWWDFFLTLPTSFLLHY